MEQTFNKYFTPTEAIATLPLVKKIVGDILQSANKIRLINESSDHLNPQQSELIQQINEDIKSFIEELNDLGCFYKDWNFNIGLVDFPTIIDGHEAFLCWKSDEEEITFYHEIETGFAGRKPIPAQYLQI